MINKYYLYKKILTSDYFTGDLVDDTPDIFQEHFPKKTWAELYRERVRYLKDYMAREWIREIPHMTGNEAFELVRQRDDIMERLESRIDSLDEFYAFYVGYEGSRFKAFRNVLESLLGVSVNEIEVYEEAEKLLTGERLVTVIVNDGKTPVTKDGKRAIAKTKVIDNEVSPEKAQEVANNFKKEGYDVKKLEFMLNIYTKTPGNELGDHPEDCLLKKTVIYHVDENILKVYKDRELVYENNNGEIRTDRVALADSLPY